MQYDNDMESPHKELFLLVRKQVLEIKDTAEIKKEKITTYSYNDSGLCHIRTMPHGVDVGFLKGAYFSDKYGLLHGETKRMRVLSLKKNMKNELKYYLSEAVKQNS